MISPQTQSSVKCLAPNRATQPAQGLCPQGQGSGVRGQAAPSLGRLRSPLSGRDQPLTRPLAGAQARQQISCMRRPRRGPGGGASVRGARSCNSHPLSVAAANSGPQGLAEFAPTQPLHLLMPPRKPLCSPSCIRW